MFMDSSKYSNMNENHFKPHQQTCKADISFCAKAKYPLFSVVYFDEKNVNMLTKGNLNIFTYFVLLK